MILESDRVLVRDLVELGIWKIQESMRLPVVIPTSETEPLLRRMLARQSRDNLHHAPCCPANHYHYQRLVFNRCNCGAQAFHDAANQPEAKPDPIVQFEIIA